MAGAPRSPAQADPSASSPDPTIAWARQVWIDYREKIADLLGAPVPQKMPVFRLGDLSKFGAAGMADWETNTIWIDKKWIKKHPDDIGLVIHEAVHLVNRDYRGNVPHDHSEAMADAIRYRLTAVDGAGYAGLTRAMAVSLVALDVPELKAFAASMRSDDFNEKFLAPSSHPLRVDNKRQFADQMRRFDLMEEDPVDVWRRQREKRQARSAEAGHSIQGRPYWLDNPIFRDANAGYGVNAEPEDQEAHEREVAEATVRRQKAAGHTPRTQEDTAKQRI